MDIQHSVTIERIMECPFFNFNWIGVALIEIICLVFVVGAMAMTSRIYQ